MKGIIRKKLKRIFSERIHMTCSRTFATIRTSVACE